MAHSDCAGGIGEEARQTQMNIRTTLEAYGLKLGDVAERTIMLADTGEWQMFNEVYKGFFGPRYPARSPLGINGLALGARVELECMAVFAS
ncbi:RidA family protein [Cupriavidus lacunae]|nr:Rid family hydrolase [Cupriavidus lacunae]